MDGGPPSPFSYFLKSLSFFSNFKARFPLDRPASFPCRVPFLCDPPRCCSVLSSSLAVNSFFFFCHPPPPHPHALLLAFIPLFCGLGFFGARFPFMFFYLSFPRLSKPVFPVGPSPPLTQTSSPLDFAPLRLFFHWAICPLLSQVIRAPGCFGTVPFFFAVVGRQVLWADFSFLISPSSLFPNLHGTWLESCWGSLATFVAARLFVRTGPFLFKGEYSSTNCSVVQGGDLSFVFPRRNRFFCTQLLTRFGPPSP